VQRGSALAAWSTEYRHTLLEQRWLAVQANGFLDIAAIRPAGSSISTTFNNQNTKAFGGIGIRIIHKFIHSAILRIDYGFSLKKNRTKEAWSLESVSFFELQQIVRRNKVGLF
jgi:hypothetical protein